MNKKVLKSICVLFVLAILMLNSTVYATAMNTNKKQIQINVKNTFEEALKVYILIPQSYLDHCNTKAGTNFAMTELYQNMDANAKLIQYLNLGNVQEQLYTDTSGVNYIQYSLTAVGTEYTFDIDPDYSIANFKFRILSDKKDLVEDLSAFSYNDNNILRVTYDYYGEGFVSNKGSDINWLKYGTMLVLFIGVLIGVSAADSAAKGKYVDKKMSGKED